MTLTKFERAKLMDEGERLYAKQREEIRGLCDKVGFPVLGIVQLAILDDHRAIMGACDSNYDNLCAMLASMIVTTAQRSNMDYRAILKDIKRVAKHRAKSPSSCHFKGTIDAGSN